MLFWVIVASIILIPTLELWGLITVGQTIGVIPTILLVILTGVIGGYLAKREGIRTYRLVMVQMRNGELPGEALLDGLMILAGGIFLLTPGFFTDFIGLFLLIPYTRAIVKLFIKRWLMHRIRHGHFTWIRRR